MSKFHVIYGLITLVAIVAMYMGMTLIEGRSGYLVAPVMGAFLLFALFLRRPLAEKLSGQSRGKEGDSVAG